MPPGSGPPQQSERAKQFEHVDGVDVGAGRYAMKNYPPLMARKLPNLAPRCEALPD